jgi:hypothetical protein
MDRGRALDGAERETAEAVAERLPGAGARRSALLRHDQEPQADPGRSRVGQRRQAG